VRKTIGLFTNELEWAYCSLLWKGIEDRCSELDINLIAIQGDRISLPGTRKYERNRIYNLAAKINLDGLLVSASIAYDTTADEMKQFFQPFASIPIVTLSAKIAHTPAVIIDDYIGMYEAVEHAIDVHDAQRILFIRGHLTSSEARNRYQAYVDVLAKKNKKLEPDLVFESDFLALDIESLVTEHIHQYGLNFDTIIASSDWMATGAIRAIVRCGFKIPADVRVYGFDDLEQSKYLRPPLTTVHQPIGQIGSTGVDMLVAAMNNEVVPEKIIIPTQLIKRQSCGCLELGQANVQTPLGLNQLCRSHIHWQLITEEQEILSPFINQLHQHLIPDKKADSENIISVEELQSLIKFYIKAACEPEYTDQAKQGPMLTTFLLLYSTYLYQYRSSTQDIEKWVPLLDVLRTNVVHMCEDINMKNLNTMEKKTHRLVSHLSSTFLANIRSESMFYQDTLDEISQLLAGAYNIKSIQEILQSQLSRIYIDDFTIAFYENDDNISEPSSTATRVLEYKRQSDNNVLSSTMNESFPSAQLKPAGLPVDERFSYALAPFTDVDVQLGFSLIQVTDRNYKAIRPLQNFIDRALYADFMLERLRRAEAEAQKASLTKSNFLANMSHEIRTPMNGVIGMTSLLLGTKLSDEQQEFVSIIRQSGESLLTIINGILDFSKLDLASVALEIAPFNIHQCVGHVIDLLAPIAAQKFLDLTLFVSPSLPTYFLGDETRIRQILLNLVSNAVKFTEQGEVCLEIQASTGSKNSPALQDSIELCCRVRDTGIGIPDDVRDRLFVSFSQADESTTRRYGGTGLGLAISRKLAELMDGTVELESSSPSGSVFCVRLRLQLDIQGEKNQSRDAQSSKISSSMSQELDQMADNYPLRILLVEDNLVNQKVATKMLNRLGYLVDIASNGLEAVEAAQRQQYDLILMDVQMPEMNGLEATRAIRQLSLPLQPRIIAMSAAALIEDQEAAHQAGMDGYLVKPVALNNLIEILSITDHHIL